MEHPDTVLVGLPPELLLRIASNMEIMELKTLSLTCRHLREIAQETLIRKATVLPAGIWTLVRFLERRPGLVAPLTHLRLALGTSEQNRSMSDDHEHNAQTSDHASCNEVKSLDCHAVAMATLFTLTRGLKKISLDTTTMIHAAMLMSCVDTDYDLPGSLKPTYDEAGAHIQGQLEEITVHLETWENPNNIHFDVCMDFSCFSNLKRLVVPCWTLAKNITLSRPNNSLPKIPEQVAVLGDALPKSLESACFLVEPSRIFWEWYSLLILCQDGFPKLREVEFKFQYNVLSIAWAIAISEENRAEVRDAFAKLKDSHVSVVTTFGNKRFFDEARNKKPPANMVYTTGDLLTGIDRCIRYVQKQEEGDDDSDIDGDEEEGENEEDREDYQLLQEVGYWYDT